MFTDPRLLCYAHTLLCLLLIKNEKNASSTELFRIWCCDCKISMCSTCAVSKHKGHNIHFLEDVERSARDKLEERIQKQYMLDWNPWSLQSIREGNLASKQDIWNVCRGTTQFQELVDAVTAKRDEFIKLLADILIVWSEQDSIIRAWNLWSSGGPTSEMCERWNNCFKLERSCTVVCNVGGCDNISDRGIGNKMQNILKKRKVELKMNWSSISPLLSSVNSITATIQATMEICTLLMVAIKVWQWGRWRKPICLADRGSQSPQNYSKWIEIFTWPSLAMCLVSSSSNQKDQN